MLMNLRILGECHWLLGWEFSADHLDNIEHRDILKLKKSRVICVLLPGVPFFLMKDSYAPARKMIEKGCQLSWRQILIPAPVPPKACK